VAVGAGATVAPAPTATPITGVISRPQQAAQCSGSTGALGPNGVPAGLPTRIQLSGVAYSFVEQQSITGNDINLVRIGCVGAFEATYAQGTDSRAVLYLRIQTVTTVVYRFEAVTTFNVTFTITGNAQAITANDTTYVLEQTWQRSVYSSITVILYAEDTESTDPSRLFAVRVDGDVVAEYVAEGGDVVEPADELVAAAAQYEVNPDLILAGGQRYLLVAIWTPRGTTTNGWVTLYASVAEGPVSRYCGLDPRRPDLFFYTASGAE